MVRERSQVDVVVHVEASGFGKAHGGVLLAFVGELGWRHTKIGVIDTGQTLLPKRVAVLVHLNLAALDDTFHIRIGDSGELGEVRQGVAVHGTGRHQFIGNEAIVLDGIEHVTERTTLREGHVAVGTDSGFSAV